MTYSNSQRATSVFYTLARCSIIWYAVMFFNQIGWTCKLCKFSTGYQLCCHEHPHTSTCAHAHWYQEDAFPELEFLDPRSLCSLDSAMYPISFAPLWLYQNITGILLCGHWIQEPCYPGIAPLGLFMIKKLLSPHPDPGLLPSCSPHLTPPFSSRKNKHHSKAFVFLDILTFLGCNHCSKALALWMSYEKLKCALI